MEGADNLCKKVSAIGKLTMESYKREFIQFLENAGVLKFGDFTAKSGRKIPYFINAGMIKTGADIATLGEFYAKAYFEKLGKKPAASTSEIPVVTSFEKPKSEILITMSPQAL